MFSSTRWIHGIIAGLTGGIAWFIGIVIFFSPAQLILSNPDFQSEKMLNAFTADPLPRTGEAPWILIVGLLSIGSLWGMVYVWISKTWTGSWWKRGLQFGIVGYVLMVPWFEFYLPWNVLHEPALLVAVELVCWAGVLFCVGLTIAGVESVLRTRADRPMIQQEI